MTAEYVEITVPRVLADLLVGPSIDDDQWTRPRWERAILIRLTGSVEAAARLEREWDDLADVAAP